MLNAKRPERPSPLKLKGPLLGVKIIAFLVLISAPGLGSETTGDVTVFRDGWGVPHIYGTSERAMAFGLGYAQAEDRLDALLENYLTATGARASVYGADQIDADFTQHLWAHEAAALETLATLPPATRSLIEGFTDGIRYYMSQHPEDVPEWAAPPHPAHTLAFSRYLVWRDLIARADREFSRAPDPGPDEQGHALWALSPERAAGDAPILVADPEGPWESPTRYYEVHLHGDSTHVWGYTIPGLPVILFGHNRHIGWGLGPAGPDVVDVYEIEMKSTAASTYSYGGRIRRLALDTLRIDVRTGNSTTTVERYAQRTNDGPVIHRDGRKAYVYRLSGLGGNAVGQLYRMMNAASFSAFYDAVAEAQMGSRSILYCDRRGRVHYLQTGHTPIRSETEVWHLPVDGNDPTTAWLGFHSQDDLIQIVDPEQGWIHDLSTSPDLLTSASPAVPDRYPLYVFNATPSRNPTHSRRLATHLSGYGRLTLQEVFDLVFDTYVADAHHWQRALADARVIQAEPSDNTEAFDLIQNWNGRADPDATGLALYLTWRETCEKKGRLIDHTRIASRQPMTARTAGALIEALEEASAAHAKRYGRLSIPWHEIHRFRRDDRSWGLPGVAHPLARSLRRTRVTVEGVVGYGNAGQAAPTVMVFHPNRIESYTALPYGQSDRKGSPHRWDQAEALYAQDRLRPTRFGQRKHLNRKRVLPLVQNPQTASPPER